MRNLASIQVISDLQRIEGKDRIVLATVLGWHVIVQKSEYQIGDKCVYVEVDSQLPEKPEFEFLRSKNFRIKTMKMAGVVSQGICFPMSILPERKKEYYVGEDVTDILGITKYEPYIEDVTAQPTSKKKNPLTKIKWLMRFQWYRKFVLPRRISDSFPAFIQKTDEIRIQTIPQILQHKIDTKFVATEKIDGTSGTYALVRHKRKFLKDKFEYIVCSRNRRLTPDNSIYWAVSQKYDIENVLKKLISDHHRIVLQGECIGPKVQGNKYKVSRPQFYAFNLIVDGKRLGSLFARSLLKEVHIPFVPIVDEDFILPDTVDDMLAVAHAQSAIGDTLREGLVVRSMDGDISFKAVDPLFLLKYNE